LKEKRHDPSHEGREDWFFGEGRGHPDGPDYVPLVGYASGESAKNARVERAEPDQKAGRKSRHQKNGSLQRSASHQAMVVSVPYPIFGRMEKLRRPSSFLL